MTTNTLAASYELPADLLEHQKALDDLVAKTKKTREAVDATAAQIPALDEEVQELTAKLAVKDADRWTAEDSELKSLDAEIKKLAEALDAKQRALSRAKNALIVHEARAPEHYEAVQEAVLSLEQGLIRFGDGAIDLLRAQMLEMVKPLHGVFAAMRVIGADTVARKARDFVDTAFLPDPTEFNSNTLAARTHTGTNLLAQPPEPEFAQLAQAMAAALAPVRASLAAGKAVGAYVPLDRRPKPYVRKGWTTEGVKGDERPFGAPPAPAPQPESAAPARRSLVSRLA